MPVIKLIGFSGEVPRMQPRQLPAVGAQYAFNSRLENGALVPVRRSRLARRFSDAPPDTIKSIYLHQGEWLQWGSVVNAAPGPVAQDRLYYTGDGAPKMRVAGKVYPLAMPQPADKLVPVASGEATSSDITTRLYAYTFVSDFGEEGEPCPISDEVEWRPGQTVTLNGFVKPPKGRAITKQRIYRSQSGTTGTTTLNFISEREASDHDFVDDIAVDDFAEAILSQEWQPPPDGMAGLISLPNGMMVGFVGKDLYFCEPWYPHAWPEKYVLTLDYPIVGLGAFGTSIAVMTTGNPYIVSGTAPENMASEKTELNLPCINARGIVDLGYAVAYPTQDGLASVSSAGASVVSSALLARNDWLKFNPQTFVAGQISGRYFASYEYVDNGTPRRGSFLFDLSGSTPFLLRWAATADAVHYDVPTSTLYALDDVDVNELDAVGQQRDVMTWRSKQFVLPPLQESFSCIKVDTVSVKTRAQMRAEAADRQATIDRNAAKMPFPLGGELNGSSFNTYALDGDSLEVIPQAETVAVRLYADGELVATKTGLNVIERLPAGYRAEVLEVEITGTAEIAQVRIASSMDELGAS
ncbi:hypothetical protein V5F77_04390 [Xanthobacter sp. DSM 24535]|uniref:hypothetical protein n=1 Tax=Roseixanthobacter psychrophilus TaxID=3119917 RepID=UPI00372A20F0